MIIATWNVNSVRARLERLLAWLEKVAPDVLCLQEIKVVTEAFPYEAVQQAGYQAAVYGQKTYNGVAILARQDIRDVARGLEDDPEARLIAATVGGVRVVSAYVPNGREVGTEHYQYKLDWLAKLERMLRHMADPAGEWVLCGDLNIAPGDSDVAFPDVWADSVLCHADARAALAAVRDWGLVDCFQQHHPEGGLYSWWDYRRGAFARNDGLRLDHVYATAPLAERCRGVQIDRDERRGDKPSDHAPVIARFR
jgi:exodeoxyribonuclease-3